MKYNSPEFSHEHLKSILEYSPETGVFTRLVDFASNARKGLPTGNIQSSGYVQISIKSRWYVAHRLAWFWMTGEWPPAEIDHINRIRSDNRWANLRPATRSQNMMNKGHRRKTDLPRGVWKTGNRYQAQIRLDGKFTHIGMFGTADEAHAAWRAAASARDAAFTYQL